jgi:4-hydroxy-3-polyprenylbenzoate decarboxylase
MSPPESLGQFLDLLVDQGQLVRVSAEVDRNLEVAAITQEVVKAGGPAVLFDRVQGSPIPVVTNLLGSIDRLCLGLGISSLNDLTQRVTDLVAPAVPANWLEALKLMPQMVEASKWPVQRADSAICQQVVHLGSDVDLTQLPIGRNWEEETQPAFLSGLTLVASLDSFDKGNSERPESEPLRFANRTPIQIVDKNTLLVHWSPHDPAWQVIQDARERDEQLPVVIVLGADPALTMAVSTPLPPYVDPLTFAGFLRSNNVQVVRGRSVAADVPVHAEIVLEGSIQPSGSFQKSSPIGLPTGFFSESQELPAVEITAITHRANPVLPLMIGGHPAAEDICLAKAAERLFVPLVRLAVPEVVDINRPVASGARHVVFVSIKKTYAMQAQKVMHALWGLDFLSTSKTIVVVDHDVDVHDEDTVRWLVASNVNAERDIQFSTGPADRFDHSSPVRGVASRMGIDATKKLTTEHQPRKWPNKVNVDKETLARIQQQWQVYGLANGAEGLD